MRTGKQIKAVIFDLDDTLIDWSGINVKWKDFNRPKIENIYNYLISKGHRLPDEDTFAEQFHAKNSAVWEEAKKTYAGASFADSLRWLLSDFSLEVENIDMDEVMRVYDWSAVPGVVPFDDTHETLDEIKKRGYKIGLITNAFQPMWVRDIELIEYQLIDYFDARITSGDTGFMKPHPAIYWRILGLLDLVPRQAIFVGDRPQNDIQGAHNVGMHSVWMKPSHVNYDLDGVKPHYTIATLKQLLPILEELENGQ